MNNKNLPIKPKATTAESARKLFVERRNYSEANGLVPLVKEPVLSEREIADAKYVQQENYRK